MIRFGIRVANVQWWDDEACDEPAAGGASMERKRVSSGTLRSIGYDERSRTLEVELTGGTVLQYSGVAPEVYRRLLNAPTMASYYRDEIEETFTAKRVR